MLFIAWEFHTVIYCFSQLHFLIPSFQFSTPSPCHFSLQIHVFFLPPLILLDAVIYWNRIVSKGPHPWRKLTLILPATIFSRLPNPCWDFVRFDPSFHSVWEKLLVMPWFLQYTEPGKLLTGLNQNPLDIRNLYFLSSKAVLRHYIENPGIHMIACKMNSGIEPCITPIRFSKQDKLQTQKQLSEEKPYSQDPGSLLISIIALSHT